MSASFPLMILTACAGLGANAASIGETPADVDESGRGRALASLWLSVISNGECSFQ